MERIFWAECPHCHGRFYCNHQELRHSGQRLFCPFCRTRFVPEAAASLDDRLPPGAAQET
ncbi:MAG TPA: MJ0042-type zinc finger domain-containing protein [Stellaceae bacterium]|nr:MJ0042-type zinc finger domain-containing protein [Stellaceae bacterium]